MAPDLRGRGRSNTLPGPYGMAAHAADCAAVVEAVSDEPVVVVGHSMGGFVATVLAARRPDLVRAVVLVDGGLPFAAADEEVTLEGLRPIVQRLQTSYTRAEYRAWFRGHPAFAHDYTPEVEAYADHDLPDDPGRPSVVPAVVEADQRDMLRSRAFADALDQQTRPRLFLHAPRGFADDPPGLYPQADRRRLRPALARPGGAPRARRQPLHHRAEQTGCVGRGSGGA